MVFSDKDQEDEEEGEDSEEEEEGSEEVEDSEEEEEEEDDQVSSFLKEARAKSDAGPTPAKKQRLEGGRGGTEGVEEVPAFADSEDDLEMSDEEEEMGRGGDSGHCSEEEEESEEDGEEEGAAEEEPVESEEEEEQGKIFKLLKFTFFNFMQPDEAKAKLRLAKEISKHIIQMVEAKLTFVQLVFTAVRILDP